MYHYKSDATRFLDKPMADHPELEQQCLANRKLLWDIGLNPEEQAGSKAAKAIKEPYTYEAE